MRLNNKQKVLIGSVAVVLSSVLVLLVKPIRSKILLKKLSPENVDDLVSDEVLEQVAEDSSITEDSSVTEDIKE